VYHIGEKQYSSTEGVTLRAQYSAVELHQFSRVVDNAALQHFCFVDATSATWSLVSLNLAQNDLGAEGARHVAEVLPTW
jgi:hypothetical protein